MAVNDFLEKMGIDNSLETDPVLIRDILEQDMKLHDLDEINAKLEVWLVSAQPLKPLFQTFEKSINEKHPSVAIFIEYVLENELIPSLTEKDRNVIIRTINHTVILDQLTKLMATDNKLMERVHEHLAKKRKLLGIRDGVIASFVDIYKATGGLFEPIKAKSVDLVTAGVIAIRKTGLLTAGNIRKRKIALSANILEAGLTDVFSGYFKNGFVGVKLAQRPYSKSWMEEGAGEIKNNSSQHWVSLYHTWNLAFITGNLSHLHLFYPKLLIPHVIDSPAETYMHRRVIALWLTVNFFLFAKLEKKPGHTLPNQQKLAIKWGEINASYASRLVDQR